MPQIISRADVKKHHDESSNWIIIHDNVYDVSSFMDEHPGGADSLLEVAGQDGTQGFEDVGHSDDARELLKKYLIGTLPPEEKSKVKPCPTTCPSNLKWALLALAGALVIGVVLKKYLNK